MAARARWRPAPVADAACRDDDRDEAPTEVGAAAAVSARATEAIVRVRERSRLHGDLGRTKTTQEASRGFRAGENRAR
jgi:hypothetical protein